MALVIASTSKRAAAAHATVPTVKARVLPPTANRGQKWLRGIHAGTAMPTNDDPMRLRAGEASMVLRSYRPAAGSTWTGKTHGGARVYRGGR